MDFKVAFLLGAFICMGLQADQPNNLTGSQCDIVILLDGTWNILPRGFEKIKSFISAVVQNFHIGPNKVQIGLAQFSQNTETEWELGSHNDTQSLLEAVDALKQRRGASSIGKGLHHALNHSFQLSAGMRPDSKKKVLVVTRGDCTKNAEIPAQRLKTDGIEIYVIGVHQNVLNETIVNRLRTIASEDLNTHLYLSTYKSLHNVAINVSSSLCHGATNLEEQDGVNSTDNVTILKEYTKTEGARVLSENRNQYTVKSVTECAAKCDSETFICKSFVYLDRNRECWTGASNSKTGRVVQSGNSVLYEKNKYLLECVNEKGADYGGTENRTKSGKLCQRWEAKSPHKTMVSPQDHPRADLESNFCRNPFGMMNSPWCYTTDPETLWEPCDIPSCTKECMHCRGENYKGKISVTENGFTCQRWDSQTPHNHDFTPTAFPEKSLEENYCRNPSGDSKPWCFTSSPSTRWDYCSIPPCTSEPPTVTPELSCISGKGQAYRGSIAVTESGKNCQRWEAQTPHRHNYTRESYPCSGLDDNFCRNPGNEQRPWCFTTDPAARWEFCSVPHCSDTLDSEDCMHCNGEAYRGNISWTIGDFTCQRWDSQTPHKHSYTPETYGESLTENYCRNPSKDLQPWCYTTDPSIRWAYCSIPRCTSPPPAIVPELNCMTGNGKNYRGTISVTQKGDKCSRWSDTSYKPDMFPCSDLDNNYCRNSVGKESKPWCYIENSWEYCDVPQCYSDPSDDWYEYDD